MNITPEEFQERLNAKLKDLTDFCAEYWGDAPELEATAVPAIKVACNFDLGDFPHKGQGFLIHAGNLARRTPEKIAVEIMQEVCNHRNQCGRCGLGIPGLPTRLGTLEYEIRCIEEKGEPMVRGVERNLIPADEPERMLFPRYAKRMDLALAKYQEISNCAIIG